ncbi:MAG: YceD family protein [Candidatus Howiella sp.]
MDLKPLFLGEKDALPVDCSFDFSDAVFSGEKPFQKPVAVQGGVFARAEVVTVSLSVTAVYDGRCDRCGRDMEKIYPVQIERVVVTASHSEGNDDFLVLPDMQLDLEELVFSELVLTLPMKHLCREDCLGICPTCGANLNDGACGCKRDTVDPRLAALQELLNK